MSDDSLAAFTELQEALSQLRRLRPSDDMVPEGVTSAEMGMLLAIAFAQAAGRDIRPGFLAAHFHTTKGAVSQTLKALEEKGFILRERSAADARAVRITLTPAGSDLCRQADRMRNAQMAALVEHLGAEDIAHLTRIVRRVVDYQETQGAYLETTCEHDFAMPDQCEKDGAPCA